MILLIIRFHVAASLLIQRVVFQIRKSLFYLNENENCSPDACLQIHGVQIWISGKIHQATDHIFHYSDSAFHYSDSAFHYSDDVFATSDGVFHPGKPHPTCEVRHQRTDIRDPNRET